MSVEIGGTFIFGSYEQDNKTYDGKEDIEWIVLAKEDNKALLISKYVLDCQPYNSSLTDVTWETCSLREWLNGVFIQTAFASGESDVIARTIITGDENPKYDTSVGNNTQDRVFLLSITEAEEYYNSDSERDCRPTAYAMAQSVYFSEYCWWWLRSPGSGSSRAAVINSGGSVNCNGREVDSIYANVRPALWIDLESYNEITEI